MIFSKSSTIDYGLLLLACNFTWLGKGFFGFLQDFLHLSFLELFMLL